MSDQSDSSISPSAAAILSGAFFLLSLFSGVLGGVLALPVFQAHFSEGMIVLHALLMTFFVMCPAALGGIAQCYLPRLLGCPQTSVPAASITGLSLLVVGVVLLPYIPNIGLFLWALGMLAVAVDVVVTFLEGRTVRFRDISPLAWSLVSCAIALISISPVILAFIVKGVSLFIILQTLRLPEMSLLLIPSLGLIIHIVHVEHEKKFALTRCVVPYAFCSMGILGPLLWAHSLFTGTLFFTTFITMLLGQVIPGSIILASLCIDCWSYSVKRVTPALWGLGASILLVLSWIGAVLPAYVAMFLPSNLAYKCAGAEIGHQAAVFGCIMALSGAFYAWFLHENRNYYWGYRVIGRVHAVVTFAGVVCAMLPSWSDVVSSVFMACSLVGYVIIGVAARESIFQSYKNIFVASALGKE